MKMGYVSDSMSVEEIRVFGDWYKFMLSSNMCSLVFCWWYAGIHIWVQWHHGHGTVKDACYSHPSPGMSFFQVGELL